MHLRACKDHLQLTHKISQWIQRPRIKSTKSFLLNHWEHNLNWGNLIYIDDDKADGIHILFWHSAPRNSKRSKNSYGTNEHISEMLNQKKKKKKFFTFLISYVLIIKESRRLNEQRELKVNFLNFKTHFQWKQALL